MAESTPDRRARPHTPRRPARTDSDGADRTRDRGDRGARSEASATRRPSSRSGAARSTSAKPRKAASTSSRRSTPSPTSSSRPARSPEDRAAAREARRRARAKGSASSKGASVSSHRTLSFGGLTISVRLLGIVVLAALLASMLIPSVYQAWRQQQDLEDITQRVAAAQDRNQSMQDQLDQWKNPDFIASQARSRLGYVKPGETQYAVTDPGPGQDTSQVETAEPEGPARPWVQIFTASLQEADTATQ